MRDVLGVLPDDGGRWRHDDLHTGARIARHHVGLAFAYPDEPPRGHGDTQQRVDLPVVLA
jgi:hypothetical protein